MGDTEEVMALERRLLEPAVRADRDALDALLHPDFEEIGSSGRVRDRAATIDELVAADRAAPLPGIDMIGCVRVATGVALVRYDTRRGDRTTHRSSLWLHDGEDWRIRFHQGTPAP